MGNKRSGCAASLDSILYDSRGISRIVFGLCGVVVADCPKTASAMAFSIVWHIVVCWFGDAPLVCDGLPYDCVVGMAIQTVVVDLDDWCRIGLALLCSVVED